MMQGYWRFLVFGLFMSISLGALGPADSERERRRPQHADGSCTVNTLPDGTIEYGCPASGGA